MQCLLAAIHPVPAEYGLHSGPGPATLTHHSQVSDVLGTLVLENSQHTELCPGLTQQEMLARLLKAVSAVISNSTSRIRALAAMGVEGRGSFSYTKPKAEGSPKVSACLLEGWNWDRSLAVEWGSSPGWLLNQFQAERMQEGRESTKAGKMSV